MKYMINTKIKVSICGDCPCYNDEGCRCNLGYGHVEYDDKKPFDCPLQEVEE